MWIKRLERILEKNSAEIRGIFLRRYPRFIFSDEEYPTAIPAFVFHTVTVESLEPLLSFLAENRYATLTADEFTDRLAYREIGQEREVLLTFDDGDKTLYTVGYPALKRFGLKAVAYIVPGITPENSDSVPLNRWPMPVCTWKEIQEMHESGTIDIQSHSMFHESIPVSGRAVDFVRPQIDLSFQVPNVALPIGVENNRWQVSDDLPNGVPIYAGGSRFEDTPVFWESASVIEACIQHVDRHGGADYFRRAGWRGGLRAVMAKTRKRTFSAVFESQSEQHKAILTDLFDSKHKIEHMLSGKTVKHFCYPWFRGSPLAAKVSADAGYVSNAWGDLLPNQIRRLEFPVPIQRLAPPYIYRLPGRGRLPLRAILANRARSLGSRSWMSMKPS